MNNRKKKNKNPLSMTKRALSFLLLNGCLWVWCSYILAFFNKTAIAEKLSEVAITEILAVFFVYATKSLFENLSKHNNWPDKKKKDMATEDEAPDLNNCDNAEDAD